MEPGLDIAYMSGTVKAIVLYFLGETRLFNKRFPVIHSTRHDITCQINVMVVLSLQMWLSTLVRIKEVRRVAKQWMSPYAYKSVKTPLPIRSEL